MHQHASLIYRAPWCSVSFLLCLWAKAINLYHLVTAFGALLPSPVEWRWREMGVGADFHLKGVTILEDNAFTFWKICVCVCTCVCMSAYLHVWVYVHVFVGKYTAEGIGCLWVTRYRCLWNARYWDPNSSPHDCAQAIQLVSHRPSQHIYLKSIWVHRQVRSLPDFLQALTDTLLCTTLVPTPEKCWDRLLVNSWFRRRI